MYQSLNNFISFNKRKSLLIFYIFETPCIALIKLEINVIDKIYKFKKCIFSFIFVIEITLFVFVKFKLFSESINVRLSVFLIKNYFIIYFNVPIIRCYNKQSNTNMYEVTKYFLRQKRYKSNKTDNF